MRICVQLIIFFLFILFLFSDVFADEELFKIVSYTSNINKEDRSVELHAVAELAVPLEITSQIFSDYDNYKEWMPTVTESRVIEKKGNTFIWEGAHRMSILGSFPCKMLYTVKKSEGKEVYEFTSFICWFDRQEGKYTFEAIENGRKTRMTYDWQARKDSVFVPSYLLKKVMDFTVEDIFEAVVKRAEVITGSEIKSHP